jgi:hypothetical protein
MAARLVLLCAAFLVTMIPSSWASDSTEPGAANAVVATATTTAVRAVSVDGGTQAICKPTISSKVSAKNRRKFLDAFGVAVERVHEVPECRQLFTDLGADGMSTLDMIVVLPIGRAQAQGGVCRGTSAYTLVGGGPIWVCRDFSRLSDTQAAMVIIHEALHHAGLSEYPQDPDAMTSTLINQMVMKKCGL